jgi:hypothetical protein
MSIVETPLIQTPSELVELAIERLQETYPNFEPNPADPQYELFLALAYICAETLILSYNVPEEIVKFVGAVVYQTQPEAAVAATAQATWAAVDAAGHTLEAGTQVELVTEAGDRVGFEVLQNVSIPTGSATTLPGQVTLQAIEPGDEGNIQGAYTLEFVEKLAWVSGATLLANPDGGSEEETTEEYTERIRELARLVKPQPILPEDFANFARLKVPTLRNGRVLAIDMLQMSQNYGPGNTTSLGSAVQRCVTIVPILENGLEPPEAAQREAYELLSYSREASFKVFVANPTYTTISVMGSGTVLPRFSASGTEQQVKSALETLLSPATWGGTQGEATWFNRKTVRYQDVVTALNNVPGFGHYTSLLVNGGTSDIVMSGVAPLPKPGTINVSLTAATE